MRISYSPESIDDLIRLRNVVKEKNPVAAQHIANELLDGINKVKLFPKIGLPVMRAADPQSIRDLFIGNYTVRYLIGNNKIYILRMWHGKEIEKDL
jgi:plasmid stabilization system protein ParE